MPPRSNAKKQSEPIGFLSTRMKRAKQTKISAFQMFVLHPVCKLVNLFSIIYNSAFLKWNKKIKKQKRLAVARQPINNSIANKRIVELNKQESASPMTPAKLIKKRKPAIKQTVTEKQTQQQAETIVCTTEEEK